MLSRANIRWDPHWWLLVLFTACEHEAPEPPAPIADDTTTSDILFLDPEPDPYTTAPWWGPVPIDIDQDSVTDIELRVLFALDSTVPWQEPLWGTQVVCVDPDFRICAGTMAQPYDMIDVDDPIDSQLAWWTATTLHNDDHGGGSYGPWAYPVQGFIGVKRTHGDTSNYGWISIHTGHDNISYLSSGFERTPDLPILTGDTGE